MRSTVIVVLLPILLPPIIANAIPGVRHGDDVRDPVDSHPHSLLERETNFINKQFIEEEFDELELSPQGRKLSAPEERSLEKRRGGGRGGGGGGRSSRGGGGRSGTGIGGSRNIAGGRTTTGSGTPKSIVGYYGGGGAVPYTSGRHSPSGLVPFLLSLSLISLFFSGAWLYSNIYSYPYSSDIHYRNETTNRNETLPVICLCQEYSVCGCDENHNQTYIDALVVNATAPVNISDGVYTSKIAAVNGTRTLVINGTLANGTTTDGGTDVVSGVELLVWNVGLLALVGIVGLGVLVA